MAETATTDVAEIVIAVPDTATLTAELAEVDTSSFGVAAHLWILTHAGDPKNVTGFANVLEGARNIYRQGMIDAGVSWHAAKAASSALIPAWAGVICTDERLRSAALKLYSTFNN